MSSTGPIFHLSIPVSDLDRSVAFYAEALGAEPAREGKGWRDVWVFGGQVTLFQQADAAEVAARTGRAHFGATLPWGEWDAAVRRLREAGAVFDWEPLQLHTGELEEQAKVYVRDPDGWSVELKAYRDPEAVLRRPQLSEV